LKQIVTQPLYRVATAPGVWDCRGVYNNDPITAAVDSPRCSYGLGFVLPQLS